MGGFVEFMLQKTDDILRKERIHQVIIMIFQYGWLLILQQHLFE
jgi:hypothetical protein